VNAVCEFVLIHMVDGQTESGLKILGYNQATVLSVGGAVSSSLREGDRIAFLGEAHPVINDTLAVHHKDIVAVILPSTQMLLDVGQGEE
jgi:hypothetical protein